MLSLFYLRVTSWRLINLTFFHAHIIRQPKDSQNENDKRHDLDD